MGFGSFEFGPAYLRSLSKMKMWLLERATGIGAPVITQDFFSIISLNGVLIAGGSNALRSI
jgi:hypothetical protein